MNEGLRRWRQNIFTYTDTRKSKWNVYICIVMPSVNGQCVMGCHIGLRHIDDQKAVDECIKCNSMHSSVVMLAISVREKTFLVWCVHFDLGILGSRSVCTCLNHGVFVDCIVVIFLFVIKFSYAFTRLSHIPYPICFYSLLFFMVLLHYIVLEQTHLTEYFQSNNVSV